MALIIPAPKTGYGRGYTGVTPNLALTLVGPSSGTVGVASTNFTLGVSGGALADNVIVTPTASSGSFTPSTVTLTPGTPTGTFTYTPFVAGAMTVTLVNNSAGALLNPPPWAYTAVPVAATTVTLTGPTGGVVNTASSPFTVSANGAISGTIVCTPSFGAGGGLLTPATVSLTTASPSGTFTYTPYATGTKTISLTNNQSLAVVGSPIAYTATAVPAQVQNQYRSYLIHPYSGSGGTDAEELYDGASGVTTRLYSKHTMQGWENVNGDYIGSDGVRYNGANAASMVPWYTWVFPLVNPLGYVSLDLTALTSRWLSTGQNKGAHFLCDATSNNSAWVDFSGTFSAFPPKLVVVTSTGTYEYIGDFAGVTIGSETGKDSRLKQRMSRSYRGFLQFEYLPDVTGTLISATLQMHVLAKDDIYPLTIKIFETDAPALYLGAAGKPAVLGLADSVGEMALVGNPSPHPAVYAAGDFRRSNVWNSYYDKDSRTASGGAHPADLFNYVTITQSQRAKTEFLPDKVHAPGTTEYRGILLTTQIGAGEIHYAVPTSKADFNDPLRPIRADCPKEMYARLYIYFENDFVSGNSDQFAFKMGLGWDAQFGLAGTYGWTAAAGSGQSDSFGCKWKWWSKPSTGPDPLTLGAQEGDVWHQYDLGNVRKKLINGVWTTNGNYLYVADGSVYGTDQWCYEGHSMRGHSGLFMGSANTKFPNLIALCNAPSHLGNPPATVSPLGSGTYDVLWDGGNYGTEQTLRMGLGVHNKVAHMFELGKWYCLESYVKMNSIDLSVTDANGNGRAINDGIMRYWIDGALVGERTTMAWRLHPDLGLEGSWFIMYHGGVAGPIDPETGQPTGHPNAEMHYRLNNYVCSTEYIGPHPTRNYPTGVNPPEEVPAGSADLSAFATAIGLAAAPLNSWIDTGINAKGAWAVKSMVDGGRYATREEVEPGPADVGNFNAVATDTLVNSNGAAWFPTKNQFFWRGGGHGGWMGGEIYWMDVATMKMGRLTNPPAMERNPASASGYGWLNTDGSPVSYHTYNGIVAVEELDSFFTMFGSPWPDGNFPNTDLWKFHIPTKTWTKVLANAMSPVSYARGPEAHYVPSQRKIAIGIPNYWRWYDPFANTLGTVLGSTSTMTNGNSVSTPTGIYCFGGLSGLGTSCTYIAHTAIGISRPTGINATTHPRIWNHVRRPDAFCPWNSYVWDGKRNMVISWSGAYVSESSVGRANVGRVVYAIDFANDHLYEFVCTDPLTTSLTYTAPKTGVYAKSQSLGSYTKWQHLTSLDCYIGCNNRMSGAAGNSQGWMVFNPGPLTRLT